MTCRPSFRNISGQVLSACDTARGRVVAEGVVGLARSLLAAGAGAAVVSLWAVPDRATYRLMDPLYYALGRGCCVATALRFAMNLLASHGGGDAAPRCWAGFVVVGADTRPIPPRAEHAAAVQQPAATPDWAAWSSEAVGEWLGQCGLGELKTACADNGVDGEMLAEWVDMGETAAKKSLLVNSLPDAQRVLGVPMLI